MPVAYVCVCVSCMCLLCLPVCVGVCVWHRLRLLKLALSSSSVCVSCVCVTCVWVVFCVCSFTTRYDCLSLNSQAQMSVFLVCVFRVSVCCVLFVSCVYSIYHSLRLFKLGLSSTLPPRHGTLRLWGKHSGFTRLLHQASRTGAPLGLDTGKIISFFSFFYHSFHFFLKIVALPNAKLKNQKITQHTGLCVA